MLFQLPAKLSYMPTINTKNKPHAMLFKHSSFSLLHRYHDTEVLGEICEETTPNMTIMRFATNAAPLRITETLAKVRRLKLKRHSWTIRHRSKKLALASRCIQYRCGVAQNFSQSAWVRAPSDTGRLMFSLFSQPQKTSKPTIFNITFRT